MSWVVECYPDNINATVIAVGITDISESEARRLITDAEFSGCDIEFRIFQSRLAGAVFTRCGPVRLRPGSVILGGAGTGASGRANKALLGGLVGASDDRSVDRRFAISVAHLFSQVNILFITRFFLVF